MPTMDFCWLAICVALAVAGWFAAIFWFYMLQWVEVQPQPQWYHFTPSALGTAALLVTLGASFAPNDSAGPLDAGSPDYEASRNVLRALRVMLVVIFLCSEWGLALLWAGRDWFVRGEQRAGAGLLVVQLPFALALLARWMQLDREYKLWVLRREQEDGGL